MAALPDLDGAGLTKGKHQLILLLNYLQNWWTLTQPERCLLRQ